MYLNHPSTFDLIITAIASMADPRDLDQVAATVETVNQMLTDRAREETDGEGALRVDFAFERISGSIANLRLLKRRALKAGASPEFLAVIDKVLAEAERARDAAPRRQPRAADAGPRAADWATAELEPEHSLLPDFLRDI
jgi:hypothetical protein